MTIVLLLVLCMALVHPCTAEPIRWFDGTWDSSGAPDGKLLSGNAYWYGEWASVSPSYEYESPPTSPKDSGGRLMSLTWGCVGRPGDKPIVAVFDFHRLCSFSEVDILSAHCTNATGFVEFSEDRSRWHSKRTFDAASQVTRIRIEGRPVGRFMRISFRAHPTSVSDWPERRTGYTFIDAVYAWGDVVSDLGENEKKPKIMPGDALKFSGAATNVVSILPMSTPRLAFKPSGSTPTGISFRMARNETETRYFAVVNGTGNAQTIGIDVSVLGSGVSAETLIGGVLPVSARKKKLTKEQMTQLITDNPDGINKGGEELDVLPFFFADAKGNDSFRRKYLANAGQVAGFPDAVPLQPGEGCVIMLRMTTHDAVPGTRAATLSAGDASLPISVEIVDLMLPPQSMWIYAYEPFTFQYPFEGIGRLRRDVRRYSELGATTMKNLPEKGSKERLFLRENPNASVGSPGWCDKALYGKVAKGGFAGMTDEDKGKIVSDARRFLERGRACGLSDDRICVFLPDEPGMKNGRSCMCLAELLKTSLPSLAVHCDPLFYVGGDFSPANDICETLLPEYNNCVDVSCPNKYIVTGRQELLHKLWLKPRRTNAIYSHPAADVGREIAYMCKRLGLNGFAYFCYYFPNGSDAWDIKTWDVLNYEYQMVFPLENDVAITPVYECMREAAEDCRLLDALKVAGMNDLLKDVLDRSQKARDRTNPRYKNSSSDNEDILALRDTMLGAFAEKERE